MQLPTPPPPHLQVGRVHHLLIMQPPEQLRGQLLRRHVGRHRHRARSRRGQGRQRQRRSAPGGATPGCTGSGGGCAAAAAGRLRRGGGAACSCWRRRWRRRRQRGRRQGRRQQLSVQGGGVAGTQVVKDGADLVREGKHTRGRSGKDAAHDKRQGESAPCRARAMLVLGPAAHAKMTLG